MLILLYVIFKNIQLFKIYQYNLNVCNHIIVNKNKYETIDIKWTNLNTRQLNNKKG